jgi:hypothetical protein
MNKDQLPKWIKYHSDMSGRLESAQKGDIPFKHVDHPIQYINFLKKEISIVKNKIEAAKLGEK